MNIDNFTDAIKNCRFCFMCRHLSGIGNVSFSEADTPRVRASLLYGVTLCPDNLANPDLIDTLYRSDLSAACRTNCVSHYDENGLNLAARRDIVALGKAPEAVAKLAKKLAKNANWQISGKGDVLYFEDDYTAAAKTIAPAFDKLMKAAKVAYRTVKGGGLGKALYILGYEKEAKAMAKAFAELVNKSGVKTIVVSNPAAYDALVNDYPAFGLKLKAKVVHSSEFLASLKLKFKSAGQLYYLPSDFLKNYNPGYAGPEKLLKALKAKLLPFGTNDEESYTCGEGAVVLPALYPELVKKLAKYIAERADNPKTDKIAVASPYTRIYLAKEGKLNVLSLEELAAACLA